MFRDFSVVLSGNRWWFPLPRQETLNHFMPRRCFLVDLFGYSIHIYPWWGDGWRSPITWFTTERSHNCQQLANIHPWSIYRFTHSSFRPIFPPGCGGCVPRITPPHTLNILIKEVVCQSFFLHSYVQVLFHLRTVVMYSACYGQPGKRAKGTKRTPNFSRRKRGRERDRG